MIDVRSLRVRYPGAGRDALAGVSLEIPDAALVAVMGGNGSGKSTLARSLNGLLLPSAGSVTVDGMTTTDEAALPKIRERVGMVFQNPHLQVTSLTVEREIAFGLQNLGKEAGALRRTVDEQLAASGLTPLRSRAPRTLSGGEQQRLALAAVLAMRPAHLVLDEATSLLSPGSRTALLAQVHEERRMRGMTVILITQFADEALAADRLVILRAGAIVDDGEPGAVLARCALPEIALPPGAAAPL
ncbi:MAG TPA: ATP-binding cassette domain-containing protein [Bacteroidota bacterium]|nr:ATP-binding cassette domain-containing protein [Bacteroidota bacterium]